MIAEVARLCDNPSPFFFELFFERVGFFVSINEQGEIMVSVTVKFKVQPQRLTQFQSAISEFSNECLKEPGCIKHLIIQDQSDLSSFAMIEEYRTADDHSAHNSTVHHIRFKEQVADCIIDKKVDIIKN